MGGTGGLPPNFLYFHFSHEYFRGEPPVPPIASLNFFLLSVIMIDDNKIIIIIIFIKYNI